MPNTSAQRQSDPELDAMREIIQLFSKATTALALPEAPIALAQSLYYAEVAAAKLTKLQR